MRNAARKRQSFKKGPLMKNTKHNNCILET